MKGRSEGFFWVGNFGLEGIFGSVSLNLVFFCVGQNRLGFFWYCYLGQRLALMVLTEMISSESLFSSSSNRYKGAS